MNVLRALASRRLRLRGAGVNHEGEHFVGELVVEPLEDGRAVLLRYSATLASGERVHGETTLLGTGPAGRLCLWPVMSELPEVLPHEEVRSESTPHDVSSVFASGPADDVGTFREEIAIRVGTDGSVRYAHAWGMPGGTFEPRSSCTLRPVDA
jgi:hypothetical protein